MTIIEIIASDNGSHRNQASTTSIAVPEGWAVVPEGMETPNFPFGAVEAEEINGVMTVTRWTAGEIPEPEPEPEPDELFAQEKETRIQQSKTDLAAYLEANPLLWTDGEYYSITAERQAQLTSKIMAATMAQNLSQPYTLTWNSTGEVCKAWTLQDLSALAFAIDARVTALVTYQQTQEVAMRNAATQEELDAIVVDYDTVPVPQLPEVSQ